MDNKTKYFILALLVLISFSIRLSWINLTIMEGDMFRDFEISESILHGNVRYVGIGSFDQITNQQSFGPIMYYILAVVFAIFKSPLSAAILVAILNSLAVIITFFFCSKYFNDKIAYIASFLYAVNPWSVYISHSHWNPYYLPFFSVIFFYFLFGFVLDHKDTYLIYSTFLLAIMLNFHLTPLLFIPLLILCIILFRRDTKFKILLYSLFFFLLPLLPFIYYNLKNNIFLLSPLLYGLGRSYSGIFTGFVQSIGIPVMLSTNYLGSYVYGSSNIFGNQLIGYLFFILTIFMVTLFIFSFIFLSLKIIKKKNFDNKYLLLLLCFIFIPILHFLRFSDVSPHYFLILYPLQFIIIAIFLSFLYKKYFTNFIGIFRLLFVLFLFLQILNIFLLYNYVNKNGATNMGEFSIPYKDKLAIINYLKDDLKGEQLNVIFYKNSKSFKYLFDKNFNNFNYYFLNSTDKIKKIDSAYLILDKTSMHKPQLTEEENDYFNTLTNKTIINSVEIYRISNAKPF